MAKHDPKGIVGLLADFLCCKEIIGPGLIAKIDRQF